MPKLTINGQKVTVNDAFLKLSPEDQDATVDEIAADIARGNRSSLNVAIPEQQAAAPQVQSFDAMGTPTGGTEAAAPVSSMPYADSMSNAGGALLNGAVRTARGVPFSDRAAAFTRSAVTGKPYAEELEGLRAAAERDKSANPGLATAGHVGGALATLPLGALGVLGKGASLYEKARAGAGVGALFGGLQGASDAPDLTDVADAATRTGVGAGVGASVGGLVPLGGAAIGGAYRAAAPFFTRPVEGASRVTGGLLSNAATARAQSTLSRLGDDALLADASPSMQGLAMGVAAKPGAAADLVTDTLTARQAGQARRLAGDMDEALGPAISPVEIETAMRARQSRQSPAYTRAIDNAGAVDTTDALAEIGRRLNTAANGSPERAALERARTMLMRETNGQPVPVSDARTLLNVRHALDDMMEHGDPTFGLVAGAARREGGPVPAVRSALDRSLKQAAPGLADADLAFASAARGQEAFDVGRQALAGGKNPMWPEDLARRIDAEPLERQALMRTGARSDIAETLGTNGNDLGALRRVVGDTEDYSRRKMATLYGEEARDSVVGAVNREQAFADTAGKIAAGSRTTPMAAGSRAIDEATAPAAFTVPKNATMFGLLAHGGEWALRKTAGALAGATNDATRAELAGILTAPAPVRDAIMQGLLADQLRAAARGQTIAGAIGGQPASRGLLGYVGDQRRAR